MEDGVLLPVEEGWSEGRWTVRVLLPLEEE